MPRSDPLIIGKDGEPTNPPFTYEKYEAWKVVVIDNATDKRRTKKFFSYAEAKEKAKELEERLGERARVGVVSRQIGYGPPHSRVSNAMLRDANDRGKYWCPYCRNFRYFQYLPYRDLKACEFCLMPEMDFHVVRCNPLLWSPDAYVREFGR